MTHSWAPLTNDLDQWTGTNTIPLLSSPIITAQIQVPKGNTPGQSWSAHTQDGFGWEAVEICPLFVSVVEPKMHFG